MLIGITPLDFAIKEHEQTLPLIDRIILTFDKVSQEYVLFKRLTDNRRAICQTVYVTYRTCGERHQSLWGMLRVNNLSSEVSKTDLTLEKYFHSTMKDAVIHNDERTRKTEVYLPGGKESIIALFKQHRAIVLNNLNEMYVTRRKLNET